MASRITNLKPLCAYTLEGIRAIALLDFEDFKGFGFNNGQTYANCRVTDIERVGDFVGAPYISAKYAGPLSGKIYNHSLETFVPELSGDMQAQLHLATKRRYLPVFTGNNGKSFTFGYEAGAVCNYAVQTEGAIGAAVSFAAASIYPLFEVSPEAVAGVKPVATFLPDFVNGAYCEVAT